MHKDRVALPHQGDAVFDHLSDARFQLPVFFIQNPDCLGFDGLKIAAVMWRHLLFKRLDQMNQRHDARPGVPDRFAQFGDQIPDLDRIASQVLNRCLEATQRQQGHSRRAEHILVVPEQLVQYFLVLFLHSATHR